MKRFLLILLLLCLPAFADYTFPLAEPVMVGNKILCTAWHSYQRPDMKGKDYEAGNYPAREGSIIYSCESGKVIAAGQMSGDRYAGWKITILQDDGVTVEYCHVSNQWVLPPRLGAKGEKLPGTIVTKGMPIGTVGRTGRTTGSHLRIVFYRDGKKIFFCSKTFGMPYEAFDYRKGNAEDLRFDCL